MPRRMTTAEREAFLAEPRVGILSIASGDERPPFAAPTWYGYEPGGVITFFTGTQGRVARKSRLIERAGVVAFTVQQDQPPYKYVTVEGTVVNEERPPAREAMLAIIRRYLPDDMAQGFVDAELADPGAGLVLYSVRPDRWLSADFSE